MTTITDLPATLPAELIADLPHARQALTQVADSLTVAIARDGVEPVLAGTYRTMVADLAEGPEALLAHGLIALLVLAESRAAPTTWALPPEPGPEVTQVWCGCCGQWCRLSPSIPGERNWVPADTIQDEVHLSEAAIDWQEMLTDHGRLSAVPPEQPAVPDA